MTKSLKVLVACEYSGVVREAFRKRGHDAWSADLLPADDGSRFHYTGDATELLDMEWDLLIAHPPCTYLTNSGARWLYAGGRRANGPDRQRWANMRAGAALFNSFLHSGIKRIAVENPVMHRYARALVGEAATQYVQPYEFGVPQTKRTGLWLRGLPKLVGTKNVKAEMDALPRKQSHYVHSLPPSADRWKLRSVTCQGIADAMAAQWG